MEKFPTWPLETQEEPRERVDMYVDELLVVVVVVLLSEEKSVETRNHRKYE
jgi:hypothetical protein